MSPSWRAAAVGAAGGVALPAELGWLEVPACRDGSTRERWSLRLIRIRSAGTARRRAILYLAGGPGESAVETVLAHPRCFLWLARHGDVVAVDQRGAAGSRPNLDAGLDWDLPLDRPLDRAGYVAAGRRLISSGIARWRALGVPLGGLTTPENAADFEDLVEASGYHESWLVGASYGTHLALTILRRGRMPVARAMLFGVEGPDHTCKLPSRVHGVLDELDRHLGTAGGSGCLAARIRECVAGLAARPRVGECGGRAVVLSGFDLQKAVADGLGDAEELARLPERVAAMEAGDHRWLAAAAVRLRRGPLENIMSYLVDAASGATEARRRRIIDEARVHPLGDAIDLPLPWATDGLGLPDLGDGFRSDVKSSVPTLLVSGSLDGRTPAANAAEVARGLPNSHQLLVEGASHRLLPWVTRLPELDAALERFALEGSPGCSRIVAPFPGPAHSLAGI